MSMTGLASSPGTAVLPMCSMSPPRSPSAPVSRAHSSSNLAGQAASYATSATASSSRSSRGVSFMRRCQACRTSDASSAGLVALQVREEFARLRGFARALGRYVFAELHPGNTALDAVLLHQHHALGMIERTDRGVDACRGRVVPERERRAAARAEAAPREIGARKKGGGAACPREVFRLAAGERREHVAAGALAHAAVAHVRVFERRVEGVTHGAALAAAGGHRRAGFAAHWKVLQSSTAP